MLLTALLTGCGTFLTRTGNQPFGAYPYHAVGIDVIVVAYEKTVSYKAVAFISIPFDIVLDTILLPPDLYFIIVEGEKKDGYSGHYFGF